MSDNVMFRYSDDGGHTWSAEQWVDIGDNGDYLKRITLHQQGSTFQRVYELTASFNRSLTIISAHLDYDVGL